jgi:DNA-binding NarL/FixJ family response regulator
MAIRTLIADDHAVVAEGLGALIRAHPDLEVAGFASNGREAVSAAWQLRPDVVVMDIAMPELNGTEATRMIRARCPETRVIMLSMYSDPVHVCHALQAGASGYVVKKSVAKEVVDAIRAVHVGKRYLSRPLVDAVIDQYLSGSQGDDPLRSLSARERQVLQLMVEGHTSAQIAESLSLSVKTVETYRARMMEKLAMRDLPSLVKFAIRHGIVSTE